MKDIQGIIDHWRSLANSPTMYNEALRRSCEMTAQALEIERDTGVQVCSCHHLPFAECNKIPK